MTVNLTRIYTRLGDDGETHLGDMSRVLKTHPRIEAYGTVDELNAQLGVALALPGFPEQAAGFLRRIQNDLFDVGADISVPHGGDRTRLRLAPEQTAWLEPGVDLVASLLEPLRSFVLPGGSSSALTSSHACSSHSTWLGSTRSRARSPPSGTEMSAPTSNRSFCTCRRNPAVRTCSPGSASATPSCALSSSTVPYASIRACVLGTRLMSPRWVSPPSPSFV